MQKEFDEFVSRISSAITLKGTKEFLSEFVRLLIFFAFFSTFIATCFRVDGTSMYPTLHNNQIVAVQKIARYNPKHGDIVAVQVEDYPNEFELRPLVKRVIALEGETVWVDYNNNEVKVNGVSYEEPYINYEEHDPMEIVEGASYKAVTVPKGCIFVMGDNRNHSLDSRFEKIGVVEKSSILGIVIGGREKLIADE